MHGQNHIKPERNIISGSAFVSEQRNIDSWHLKCKFWWMRLVTISTLLRYRLSPDVTSLQLPQDRGITNWTKQNNAISNNTGEQKIFFLVPWFLGLFLGLCGALIQKNALDRPHQL